MSVAFSQLSFQSTAGVDVILTVEAPPGHVVVSNQTVGHDSTATIALFVQDCSSVLLRVNAGDADPAEELQTFAVMAPLCLQTVNVKYSVADFRANITAST